MSRMASVYGSSGPSSKVIATSFPVRGPWLMVPPNQLTVGVLAATHDMSRVAHVVATPPTPSVRRDAAPGRRSLGLPTMLPTAAAITTITNHHRAAAALVR